ncbi:2-5A-dependent ribonuclease [Aspergillus lentulus]|uniref:2-5A-dependent ribonuclease n=1 Tax=Aspergillus lentulus TaxID=293939 RepID=A0AAN4PM44_ASPLE|nr:2-5A-dependent ribonuclease [Aspergillus lentulus]
MSMDPVDEPSRWVCRLTSFFAAKDAGTDVKSSGTGFMVNIPGSANFSILTAAHNLLDATLGSPKRVEVVFTNGLEFPVFPGEWHISQVYSKDPTTSATHSSSHFDYGLIVTDRQKHLDANPDFGDPGACGIDILMRDIDLLHKEVAVHGYPLGTHTQQMNSSSLDTLDDLSLHYDKDTMGGVSGGPVFISKDGPHTAIGIHNYYRRATRITPRVMLEILSWIGDYPLHRTFRVDGRKGLEIYLQATTGSRPNIIARPGLSFFKVVLASAPKPESDQHCHYLILPPQSSPQQLKPLLFLTLRADQTPPRLVFQEQPLDAPSQIRIDLLPNGPKSQWTAPSWPDASRLFLKVNPKRRKVYCKYGCITPDDEVVSHARPTNLCMNPYRPPSQTDPSVSEILDLEGLPPLYCAVRRRDGVEVTKLLGEGADARFICECGTSVLSKAAENGDVDILNVLESYGAAIDTMNHDRESPEMLAQRNGHVGVLDRLEFLRCEQLEKLLMAARKGDRDEIGALIERGVPPDRRNISSIHGSLFQGWSALELAARYGHHDSVRFLLQNAKVSATEANSAGVTALHYAAQNGHESVAECLLEFGADGNAADENDMTPLHHAAAEGHVGVITLLCSWSGIDINVPGPNRATPLMLAAENDNKEAVQRLLEQSADATPVDGDGQTAWDIADSMGYIEICDMLPFG